MAAIEAMTDVVWPAAEADELARQASVLAELIERQLPVRRHHGERACDEWAGAFRQLFDPVHQINLGNGAEVATNLRAIAASLAQASGWVHDENAARSAAREREADDATWGGLKRFYNALAE